MMKNDSPKYSVIIPARNGGAYLPTCVETVVSQSFADYEIILSDDHSTDSTIEYLASLSHPNIVKIVPPEGLSMTEHWEWALTHARGDWLIFLGQDDGLQPYFFELAEALTDEARKCGIRAVSSSRAYYFWEGCEGLYGDTAVNYVGHASAERRSALWQSARALFGDIRYFELPTMYTSSLFHRRLIQEVRERQGGRVFSTHPQDANLAAMACSLERRFLHSNMPLGWIGTSPKSAGMAISARGEGRESKLRDHYLGTVKNSPLRYNARAGDFSIASSCLYFWAAMLETSFLRSRLSNAVCGGRLVSKAVLAAASSELLLFPKLATAERAEKFRRCLKDNGFANHEIRGFATRQLAFMIFAMHVIRRAAVAARRIRAALARAAGARTAGSIRLFERREAGSSMSLLDAQARIRAELAELSQGFADIARTGWRSR
jgi:hypothetical protein